MNDKIKSEPTSVWHNASEEPDNKKNIVIWAEGFSNLIAVEEYRPKEKKFYYESGDHYYNVDITRKGLIWAYVDELLNLAKKEEPVSEEFKKAAVEAFKQIVDSDKNNFFEIFKAGTQWQKQQFEKNRLKHCDSITNEQAELEQGFVEKHLDMHQRMPTFLDAIEYGMQFKEQQLMAKAVDGEVTYGKSLAIPSLGYRLDKEGLDFGDKVKVIIIKKD